MIKYIVGIIITLGIGIGVGIWIAEVPVMETAAAEEATYRCAPCIPPSFWRTMSRKLVGVQCSRGTGANRLI